MQKILQSLLERIHENVISLDDNKNLNNLKVEELIGSLTISEMKLKPKKKDKGMFLKAEAGRDTEPIEESLPDATLAMVAPNFQRFMNKTFKKNGGRRRSSNNFNIRN